MTELYVLSDKTSISKGCDVFDDIKEAVAYANDKISKDQELIRKWGEQLMDLFDDENEKAAAKAMMDGQIQSLDIERRKLKNLE